MNAPPAARTAWHRGHAVWVSAGLAPAVGVHVRHMYSDRVGVVIEPRAAELVDLLADPTQPWMIVAWEDYCTCPHGIQATYTRAPQLSNDLVW